MMFLSELFFPPRCLICGFLGVYICLRCERRLVPLKKQHCLYCKKTSLYGFTHNKCEVKYGVDGVYSLYNYNTPINKIIKGLKYLYINKSVLDLRYLLGKNIYSFIFIYKKTGNIVIQPVPISKKRLNGRGFSQTQEIGDSLSFYSNFPTVDILENIRENIPQALLPKEKREKNIKNSFRIKEKKKIYKNILLVDDVVTTGATIKEAAVVLKKHGVERVYVFSVAKG